MARTSQTNPQQQQRKRFNWRRCVTVIISIIFVLGLVALFTWLALRPKKPVFSIVNATLSNSHYNLEDFRLNSIFYFTIRTFNRNHRVSIYYDRINSSVAHSNQSIAFYEIPNFFQRHRNVTDLKPTFRARDVALSRANVGELGQEKNETGTIELKIHVTARIWFKTGVFKSRERALKVVCGRVVLNFNSQDFCTDPCTTDLV